MVLRPAQPDDITAIRAFIFEHGVNEWNYLCAEDLDPHLAGLANGQTLGLIALDGTNLVGIATGGITNSFNRYESAESTIVHASVSEVVVATDRCGMGLGSRILQECAARLHGHGAEHIYAERHEENLASAGMMRKAGFEVLDTFRDPERRPTGSRRTSVCRLDYSRSASPRS